MIVRISTRIDRFSTTMIVCKLCLVSLVVLTFCLAKSEEKPATTKDTAEATTQDTTEATTSFNYEPRASQLYEEFGIKKPTKREKLIIRRLINEEIMKEAANAREVRLKEQKNSTEQELKRIKAPLSVRERIEYLENMISPAYKQTKQFTSTKEEVGFHEARWVFMLTQRTDDPMMKKMLQFIADNACRGMTIEIFARRVAGFFHFTSNKIHVPPLETYTAEQLNSELRAFFGASFDDLTFDIVCSLKDFNNNSTTTLESTISNSTILPEMM